MSPPPFPPALALVVPLTKNGLGSSWVHHLFIHVQVLHSLGLANSDHTTLLLNTYTKLRDVQRLDSFIRTESRHGSTILHPMVEDNTATLRGKDGDRDGESPPSIWTRRDTLSMRVI